MNMTTRIDTPTAFLDKQTTVHPLTVLVFFRGSWCPFCQGYLREMNGEFLRDIREKGGKLIAITSQSGNCAREAKEQWGLDYPVYSEPSNTLAERYDVAITDAEQTPLANTPGEYPQGMAQPAVVAFDQQGEVLFRWAIDPSEMNLDGASDRPLPEDIWPVIEAAMRGEDRELESDERLNPTFLARNYPTAHATFTEWVEQSTASR